MKSLVRQSANIHTVQWEYNQTAVVATLTIAEVTNDVVFASVLLSLHMEYVRDIKFTVCFYLFFVQSEFSLPGLTNLREIWRKVSPISQADLSKFWRQYTQG